MRISPAIPPFSINKLNQWFGIYDRGGCPSLGLMDANPSAVFLPISMQQAVVPGKIDQLGDPLNRWLNLIGTSLTRCNTNTG